MTNLENQKILVKVNHQLEKISFLEWEIYKVLILGMQPSVSMVNQIRDNSNQMQILENVQDLALETSLENLRTQTEYLDVQPLELISQAEKWDQLQITQTMVMNQKPLIYYSPRHLLKWESLSMISNFQDQRMKSEFYLKE